MAKKFAPGTQLKEGIVCKLDDAGVYLGRPAEEGEACPPQHQEFRFEGRRVFMHEFTAPHSPAILHD